MADEAVDTKALEAKKDAARKADSERHRKREDKEALDAQIQAEEDERNGKAKLNAPAAAKVAPIAVGRAPQAMTIDCQLAHSAINHFHVRVRQRTPEEVLADPHFLYALVAASKITRYAEVLLHDEAWRWEVPIRVMGWDSELQTVQSEPLGPILHHDITKRAVIDFGACTIEYRGEAHRWVVAYGITNLVINLETREEAEQWLNRRKVLAAQIAA